MFDNILNEQRAAQILLKNTETDHIQVSIKSLTLSDSILTLSGSTPPASNTINFKNLKLSIPQFNQKEKSHFSGTATLENTPPIHAQGLLSLNPFSAEIDITGKEIPLTSLKPFTRYSLPKTASGVLNTEGTFLLPEGIYTGRVELNDFVIGNSASRLKWASAKSKELKITINPFQLTVSGLTIHQPYLLHTANQDEPPFFKDLFTATNETTPSARKGGMRFNEITLSGGTLEYKDPTVSPPFETELIHVNGTIDQFSLANKNQTHFSMTGQAEGASPVTLNGTASQFPVKPVFQLTSTISSHDLGTLAPYIEPYLGHKIIGGSIDVATTLDIQPDTIHSSHKLGIQGLKLGAKLKQKRIRQTGGSWQKLPFLHALLEDNTSRITQILTINRDRGQEYPLWDELQRRLRKLLLRTMVSPFTLLSEGNSNQPLADHLKFAVGEKYLSTENKHVLQSYGSILQKRPRLQLSLSGFADAKLDRLALVDIRKEVMRKKMLQQGADSAIGQLKPKTINITDDNLVQLAVNRAQICKKALIEFGVKPKQITLTSPPGKILNAAHLGNSGARVNFTLEVINNDKH